MSLLRSLTCFVFLQVTGNEDSVQSLEDVEETTEETSEEAETPPVMSA